MKQKIIPFPTDVERYLKLSESKADSGDLLGALGFLLSAYKKKPTLEITADIGDAYADMNLYELSNKFWFKFLSKSEVGDESEAYAELALNYYYLNDLRTSTYYLEKKLTLDGIPDNPEEDLFKRITESFDRRKSYRIVYPAEKADYSIEINKAKLLLTTGDYEGALKEFSTIPEESPHKKEVLEETAIAEFLQGNTQNAIDLIKKDLKEKGPNVSSFCNLASMYKFTKEKDKSRYYYESALNLNSTAIEDVFKISTCALEQEDFITAVKYLDTVVKERPYEITLLNFYGQALINVREYEKAYDIFSKILRIDNEQVVAEYYVNLAKELKEGKEGADKILPLKISDDVPDSVIKERERFLLSLERKGNFDAYFCEEKKRRLFYWGLRFGTDFTADVCLNIMRGARSKEAVQFIDGFFIDNAIKGNKKRVFLYYLVKDGYKKKICAVNGDVFTRIKIPSLRCEKSKGETPFFNGFARATFYLAFTGQAVFDKLAKTADLCEKLYKNIDLSSFSEDEIATFIAIKSRLEIVKESQIYKLFKTKNKRISDLIEVLNKGENNGENN